MFIIDNIDVGRFGNKLMYYNNLVQVSNHFKRDYSCPSFQNNHIFEFSNFPNINLNYTTKTNSDFLIKNKFFDFEKNIILLEPCLGDLFYEFDTLKTTDIFKFKENYNYQSGILSIGVHFRGNDFQYWDPKSILKTDYYLTSIDDIIKTNNDVVFTLYTDDLKLDSFINTVNYLTENKINFNFGNPNDLIGDFVKLSYSDIIISSPSTFSISAGFCGKENKKIIHSKEWVEYQCNKNDKFWIGFYNGGNSNYKKYKIL